LDFQKTIRKYNPSPPLKNKKGSPQKRMKMKRTNTPKEEGGELPKIKMPIMTTSKKKSFSEIANNNF